jgi:ribosome biogenesis GTPase
MLDRLGWTRYFERPRSDGDMARAADAGLVLGRVRRVDRGECDVSTGSGELRVLSDSTRAQRETAPATGDWVLVDADAAPAPRLERVLPRATAIVRRDPSEEVIEQVLVANVDVVGVVAAVDRPLNLAKIERFLVLAADSGAYPVVVCTKVDLGVGDEWAQLPDLLGDIPVLHTSASAGNGVDAVHDLVRDDRTLVLLGESGAGKSTLVNALVGAEVQRTSEVRSGDAKGRHTTTARELVLVPGGGVLIDTPGVRGVGLWDAAGAVERVFADIGDLASGCRFGDCSHRVEPGCAVQAAVDAGDLDGARVARYLRLLDELDEQDERREDQRRRARGRRR